MQSNNAHCATLGTGPSSLTSVDNICKHTVSLKNLNPCLLMMPFTSQWNQLKGIQVTQDSKTNFQHEDEEVSKFTTPP